MKRQILVLATAGAVLFAACGSDSTSSPAETTAAAADTTTAAGGDAKSCADGKTLEAGSLTIATGDPAHVPVGRYAQAALEWLGQWQALAPRLARADNARAALLLVERGEAPLGIVYATDAAISPGVRAVATFPAESHPPITYPVAVTRRAEGNAAARDLLAFVTGPEAAETWRRFGFSLAR